MNIDKLIKLNNLKDEICRIEQALTNLEFSLKREDSFGIYFADNKIRIYDGEFKNLIINAYKARLETKLLKLKREFEVA